jgi:uncharacterized repeat protein (TIGR03803 family)
MRNALIFLAAAGALLLAAPAHATSRATLYSFCSKTDCTDGSTPAGLVADPGGTIYGATASGGTHGAGSLYALVPGAGGKYKHVVLYSFCAQAACADGVAPNRGIVIDLNGNLYGTTPAGGTKGSGTIYELSPNAAHTKWTLKTLVSFCAQECGGFGTQTGLLYAGIGTGAPYDGTSPLYGVGNPTSNQTGMFALTYAHKLWTLHNQTCKPTSCPKGFDDFDPNMDAAGNFYGISDSGGEFGWGVAYKMTFSANAWNTTTLWSFCHVFACEDGSVPTTGVVMDSSGTLYGTTQHGGLSSEGVLYKLTLGSSPQIQLLYSFCMQQTCPDGANPNGGDLLLDGKGGIFGTTPDGGNQNDPIGEGNGVLFGFVGGKMHTYYKFCNQPNCVDGAKPSGNLLLGPSATIIGTTPLGGKFGKGTIYRLTP